MEIITNYGVYPSSGHIIQDIGSRLCKMYQDWCNENDRSFKVGTKKYYSAPYNKAMGLGSGGCYFGKARLSSFFHTLVSGGDWDLEKDRKEALNPPKYDVEVIIRHF